ncbi:hypothetical protein EJB05_39816, partial [Eragrostis curvula]
GIGSSDDLKLSSKPSGTALAMPLSSILASRKGKGLGVSFLQAVVLGLVLASAPPVAQSWSKEGHMLTCQIAQDLLEPDAAHAVKNLLPEDVNGDLSALCVWPDQVRHWYKYRWSSPLHFIDTPDKACTFVYSSMFIHFPKRDAGIAMALMAPRHVRRRRHRQLHLPADALQARQRRSEIQLDRSPSILVTLHGRCSSEFRLSMQPMHVGFTSDQGGNSIDLRWFRHKSNLHHVWDREIILTAMDKLYGKDMDLFRKQLEQNFTKGTWSDDVSSWADCEDLQSCPTKYATESIGLACKWAYNSAHEGETLSDDYFNSRLPIVSRRIAQGGVRLAMFLNRIFGAHNRDVTPPT